MRESTMKKNDQTIMERCLMMATLLLTQVPMYSALQTGDSRQATGGSVDLFVPDRIDAINFRPNGVGYYFTVQVDEDPTNRAIMGVLTDTNTNIEYFILATIEAVSVFDLSQVFTECNPEILTDRWSESGTTFGFRTLELGVNPGTFQLTYHPGPAGDSPGSDTLSFTADFQYSNAIVNREPTQCSIDSECCPDSSICGSQSTCIECGKLAGESCENHSDCCSRNCGFAREENTGSTSLCSGYIYKRVCR